MATRPPTILIRITIAVSLAIGSGTTAWLVKDHMAQLERMQISQQYETQIHDLKNEQEREKGRLLNEIGGLKDKLDTTNKELMGKTAELEGKKTEVRSLQEMIDRNPTTTDVKDLEKKLGEANGEVARLSLLTSNLQGQVTDLTSERNELSQKAADLENSVAALESELTALRAENGELRSELDATQNELIVIQNELSKQHIAHQNDLSLLFKAMTQEFYGDRLRGGVFGKNKKRAQREAYVKAREIYQQLNLQFSAPQVQDAIARINEKIKDIS